MIENKNAHIQIPFKIIYSDSIYGVTSNNKLLCENIPSKLITKF
jgi:hypothetical protein